MAASPKPRSKRRAPFPKTSRDGASGANKKTPENMTAALAVLRMATGTPSKAAATIGVDRRTLYMWRESDLEFARAWDEAAEASIDDLEEAARVRGVDGVITHESWRDGAKTGETRTYSDGMLSLLLKGRRRSVFGDKQEVTGPQGGPIQHDVTIKFVSVEKK